MSVLLKTAADILKLTAKSILDPLDAAAIRCLQQHCVKTAGWDVGQRGEVMLGGAHQFALFGRIDAGCGAAEIATAAQAHFGEHQCAAILQDQVYLAKTTAIILLQKF